MRLNNNSKLTDEQALALARAFVEQCVLHRMCCDVVSELMDFEPYCDICNMELIAINSSLNRIKMSINRRIGDYNSRIEYNDMVCDIVNKNRENISWVKKMLRSTITQYVVYDKIDIVIPLGFLGGIVEIMKTVGEKINDRQKDNYDRIKEMIGRINVKADPTLLNDVQPDLSCCHDCFVELFKRICNDVNDNVCNKKEAV